MKQLCIYHGNCADGFGAAVAVRMALGDEIEFYAGVHQTEPPDVTGREVLIVDFSYKRPVLLKMAEQADRIIILDHHASAEKDLVDLPDNVTAVFDMERSGAMIAWEYFHSRPAPKLIHHIQDRDLWQFKLDGTREIQAALFSYPYDFETWIEFMNNSLMLDKLKKEGKAIERKHFKDIKELIDSAAYRMNIAGHDVPVLNAPYFFSSDAGHIMAKDEPFAACYWDTADGRIFSLRSTEDGIDVSEIASQFGGGGHKRAAGFKVDNKNMRCDV